MEVYEQRAAAAESKIMALTERLARLEATPPSPPVDVNVSVKEAVRNVQGEMLLKLRSLRDSMKSEGNDLEKVKEQRDQALAENAELKKDIEKLNYRIKHLIRSLEEAEAS
mmetsp:Transcript_28081/g.36798  ORF Transcript_28081/g.36798 Transcript_28081/m.36798 type:complete len:111 (+) Transcript_28081:71-403(+)|eukprot:CAMPEP_0117740108 /NCGR_PEP_ID=MMETSP0947-20121206/4150_1 /TAXON_ID=44440 /ORGANISM="Chattonella subsalsa, Strain CCMP2191" /LENGTH=110 /DNA_ID=CAMNT_0005556169 /DNA_START=71 /DNA_END=403 /DNA_ORIENTATION=-